MTGVTNAQQDATSSLQLVPLHAIKPQSQQYTLL